MGEIMKIYCHPCRKTWQCMTGCGLQHGRKENIIAAFQANEQGQVSEWMGKSHIPLYDFRYQIASCPFCHELVSVPVLKGIEDEEVFIGSCPVCKGHPQLPLQEEIADMDCPVCRQKTLTFEEIGHWD